MPAFDPVRDAVLNSPSSQAPTVPSWLSRPISDPSPTSQPHNNRPSSPLANTSVSRRATDLSVLLNSDVVHPLRIPQSAEAPRSTLSHLLHTDDKLSTSEPFSRLALPSTISPLPPDSPLDSPSRPSSAASGNPRSRPASSSNMPSASRTSSVLPYDPSKRITPPTSILIPLSREEVERFRSWKGEGSLRLAKRKRPRSAEPEDALGQPRQKKLAGDVNVVVDHYNSRPEVGVVQRQVSPIIGLKNFNNWVKSVLITRFAHPALAGSPIKSDRGRNRTSGKVLDMGCGKGGDITKWAKAKVKELYGVDIAGISVDQARQRYQITNAQKFEAHFAAIDCFTERLADAFPPARLAHPFDVISMQFCMHYAFESIQKARCMLDNVTRYLRTGGVFIGTIPNSEQLLENLDNIPPESQDLSFGNSVYRIRFDSRDSRPTFGQRYHFFLQDAVDNVPEYIVRWDNFVELAKEYKLHLLYKSEFHEVFREHQEIPEFEQLMQRMKVVDKDGSSSMDEDQWEAANIYIAFAFEKR